MSLTRAFSFKFMTSDQATCPPGHCMEIGVNTASFGEMLPGLVDHCFKLLCRIVRHEGLFFTCNRIEKWMDEPGNSSPETAQSPKHCLRFEGYPWSPLDRDLFYGRSAFHDLVQPQSPMMHRLCQLASMGTVAKQS